MQDDQVNQQSQQMALKFDRSEDVPVHQVISPLPKPPVQVSRSTLFLVGHMFVQTAQVSCEI